MTWKSFPASRTVLTPRTSFYCVKKVAAVTGQDLRNARPALDENNRPAVGSS